MKQAEVDAYGTPTVHVYANKANLPETLNLDIGEFSKSYYFLMSIDMDQEKALAEFEQGTSMTKNTMISTTNTQKNTLFSQGPSGYGRNRRNSC